MVNKFHKFYLKQRFFPSFLSIFINPFYLTRKALLNEIKKISPSLNGNLLDFGCGSKPYLNLFVNIKEYVGVDMQNDAHDHSNEEVDVFYDGKILPFENETFQNVLSSEVFEHVPNIDDSIHEIFRVLKPNGKLLITTPFSFPEHEMPFDFRRLTHNGLIQILNENGFEIEYIKRYGKMNEVVGQIIAMGIHDIIYSKNKYLNLVLNFIFISPIILLTIIFGFVLKKNNSLYFGTIVLARKR